MARKFRNKFYNTFKWKIHLLNFQTQISKTVSSWVGGIYDWVAASVDFALKPSVQPIQNNETKHILNLESAQTTSHLNPNAKVFTPQVPLNPNAKEFLPSSMAACPKSSIHVSSTIMPSIEVSAVNKSEIPVSCSHPSSKVTTRSSVETDVEKVLNGDESDLSQMVIEQLIQETNKQMETEKHKNDKTAYEDKREPVLTLPESPKMESETFQLKSVAARKRTPWINARQKLGAVQAFSRSKGNSTPILSNLGKNATDKDLSEESDIEEDDSDDEFEDTFPSKMGHDGLSRIRKHSSRKQSASSSCDDFDIEYDSSRVRSLSVCSDDSNFIEFGTPPTPDLSKVDQNAKPKQINCNEGTNKSSCDKRNDRELPKRCLLQSFVVHARAFVPNVDDDTDDDDTEDEGSDSDDDPDWDEVDGDDDIANDPLWQSFTARVLVCPMSAKKSQKEHDNMEMDKNIDSTSSHGIVSIIPTNLQNDHQPKSEIEVAINPTKKSPEEIREANHRWNSFYVDFASNGSDSPKVPSCDNAFQSIDETTPEEKASSKCSVRIAPADSVVIILEDPEEAKDLRDSRISDLAQRHADKERMEKLLTPVFQSEHRKSMRDRIQRGAFSADPNLI